jgi:hypothetical protein
MNRLDALKQHVMTEVSATLMYDPELAGLVRHALQAGHRADAIYERYSRAVQHIRSGIVRFADELADSGLFGLTPPLEAQFTPEDEAFLRSLNAAFRKPKRRRRKAAEVPQ